MTRAKKSFAVDAQRGEGAAEREQMLRSTPLQPQEELQVADYQPQVEPLPEQQQRPSPMAGNVFRSTDRPGVEIKDTLPTFPGFEMEQPDGIDRTNAILAAINDLLGGSEEVTAMMR